MIKPEEYVSEFDAEEAKRWYEEDLNPGIAQLLDEHVWKTLEVTNDKEELKRNSKSAVVGSIRRL